MKSPKPESLFARLFLLTLGVLALAGCEALPMRELITGPSYQPHNVHRSEPYLPIRVRRVAVLPLTADEQQADTDAGQTALQPVLRDELGRTGKFELVFITREQLRQWTGRPNWSASDKLPPDFFKTLRAEFGCDAVLFCRLTRYQAYPPLAVGWHLKLVDAQKPRTLWAVDEIFDAGDPKVVAGARRFQQRQPSASPVLADSRSILSSPRQFGHYTASVVLATLPER